MQYDVVARIDDYMFVTPIGCEKALRKAVNQQPVVVRIDSRHLYRYKGVK